MAGELFLAIAMLGWGARSPGRHGKLQGICWSHAQLRGREARWAWQTSKNTIQPCSEAKPSAKASKTKFKNLNSAMHQSEAKCQSKQDKIQESQFRHAPKRSHGPKQASQISRISIQPCSKKEPWHKSNKSHI